MAYLYQIYSAHHQLCDGRQLEVRYRVDRLAHGFDAEPEEHFGLPQWTIEEMPVEVEQLSELVTSDTMNNMLYRAVPVGPPKLASEPSYYGWKRH